MCSWKRWLNSYGPITFAVVIVLGIIIFGIYFALVTEPERKKEIQKNNNDPSSCFDLYLAQDTTKFQRCPHIAHRLEAGGVCRCK